MPPVTERGAQGEKPQCGGAYGPAARKPPRALPPAFVGGGGFLFLFLYQDKFGSSSIYGWAIKHVVCNCWNMFRTLAQN